MILYPGDIIKTNYGTGPYRIDEIIKNENGTFYFICSSAMGPHGHFYLNDYVMNEGEYCLAEKPWLSDSSGYSSNHGGRDGKGHDEIILVKRSDRPVQLMLF